MQVEDDRRMLISRGQAVTPGVSLLPQTSTSWHSSL